MNGAIYINSNLMAAIVGSTGENASTDEESGEYYVHLDGHEGTRGHAGDGREGGGSAEARKLLGDVHFIKNNNNNNLM